MEKFASDFYIHYQKVGEIDLMANKGGKRALAPFLARVIFAIVMNASKYDVIHLYDAVLSPLIPIIRLCSATKISFTVNGLDIVYAGFGYQTLMRFFIKRADRIIALSQYTKSQCLLRGIPIDKLTTIPVGINPDTLGTCSESKKRDIVAKFGVPNGDRKKLLTVGRLVKRKGHAWFIGSVLSRLPHDYIYLIAGAGPEESAITALVRQLGLTDRVFVLGFVTDEEKSCLYQISDLFIMPNISVENDQEGFGIVLLEAGCYGLPVIASNIEGIKDAVLDHQTGLLISEGDAQGFYEAILNPDLDIPSIRNTVISNFDWDKIATSYRGEFERLQMQA